MWKSCTILSKFIENSRILLLPIRFPIGSLPTDAAKNHAWQDISGLWYIEYSVGIFVDLRKAFDTVIILFYIARLQIIFSEASRWVVLQSILNTVINVYLVMLLGLCVAKYDIPQGSKLSPFLFLLFINDLHNSFSILTFILFVDESGWHYSNKSYI